MGDSELPSASETVKNIILVGRTGNGKSATGNSLVGKQVFISKTHAAGVTMKCQTYKTETSDGLVINVIDTPGLFDLSVSSDYISKEIVNCLTLAKGGLHAVVLVLSVRTRITQEEESVLSSMQSLFGSKIVDYLVVLFTGGDELETNNQTLDDYLHEGCPEFLMRVLTLCGGRRVLFNNRTMDEGKKVEQVQQLLALVSGIGERNRGKPFTHDMHRDIKEETDRLWEEQQKAESQNLGEGELTEMKKQLQKMYEDKLSQMTEMVEKTLNEASAAQEREILELKENLQTSQRENDTLRNIQDQQQRRLVQVGRSVPGLSHCNIL